MKTTLHHGAKPERRLTFHLPFALALCLLSYPPSRCWAADAAAPLRIVAPSVTDSKSLAQGDHMSPVIALHLRERLAECPHIRVISDNRATAIMRRFGSGARRPGTNSLVGEFSAFVPVDAIIKISFADGAHIVAIQTAGGIHKLTYPPAAADERQAMVLKASADIADKLGFPPEDKKIVTERRFISDSVFHGFYFSQAIWADWPMNPYEFRLKHLQPIMTANPNDTNLAAAVVKEACGLVNARSRGQEFAGQAQSMATLMLPIVLGSRYEENALLFVSNRPSLFQEDLIGMAKPISGDVGSLALDELGDDSADEKSVGAKLNAGAMDRVGNASRGQRLGALRALGFIRSREALQIILSAAKSPERDARESAAAALQHAGEGGGAALKTLAADRDAATAFAAGYSLWMRGDTNSLPRDLARRALKTQGAGDPRKAAEILAALGTADDIAALRTLTAFSNPDVRRLAWGALLRLGAVDAAGIQDLLLHDDERIVESAIELIPDKLEPPAIARLITLAGDPTRTIQQAACTALAKFRPPAGPQRDAFDLAIEHPYIRKKIVDRIAAANDPAAITQLEETACSNPDPQTRIYAIQLLAGKAPERGRRKLIGALSDPYTWVRFRAAILLADLAESNDAAGIRSALASEADKVVKLYLEDALARIEGRPRPPPPPAARRVADRKGLTWMTGMDPDAMNSPFGAYYILSVNVSDEWKEAYRSGKIFFGRATPVGNPGLIITDPDWRDRFWLALNAEVPEANLPYIDGLVYGEETMNFDTGALWPNGWRLFCLDTGIDPQRVKGKTDNLTDTEKQAWHYWAAERCVDGFNELYDYTKFHHGKLKPGLQVATFLPGQGAITPADHRWRFDVGGIYDYKGCNRIAGYMLVRRMKTIWPERPVIWLSLGIGGYEMNPVRYTTRTPETPMVGRGLRCYADTVSAWAAGADPGWFSTWIFVDHKFKGGMANLKGVQIVPGDIFANTNRILSGIAFSFNGVDKLLDLKTTGKPELSNDIALEETDAAELQIDTPDPKENPILKKIEKDRRRMYDGFRFYGKYVYDCGRLFSDLPRLYERYPALAIWPGISVWTAGSEYPAIPGFALLNRFDFLCDINKAVGCGLDEYRLIAVHSPGALTDATIAGLTQWLKATPGLLYIHNNLEAANAAEVATPSDLDGKLDNDWPWETSVKCVPLEKAQSLGGELQGEGQKLKLQKGACSATFTVSDPKGKVLLSGANGPVLVLWQDPAFKGAVLFDGVVQCSREYLDFLAATLGNLAREKGIGLAPDGPMLQQVAEVPGLGIKAAASSLYYRGAAQPSEFEGIDLLTGEMNPAVGPGSGGAIVADTFTGQFTASHGGIAVLSEAPLENVKPIDGGLEVTAKGLFRAGSRSGVVNVAVQPDVLPIKTNLAPWVLYGTSDGIAELPIGEGGKKGTTVYIRSGRPVKLTQGRK